MAMPEATMDKQDDAIPWKNQVGPTGQSSMQPKSQARPMQMAAHDDFGPRVPRANARHHPTSGRPINDIHHKAIFSPSRRCKNLSGGKH
jgi:hypothetical protein